MLLLLLLLRFIVEVFIDRINSFEKIIFPIKVFFVIFFFFFLKSVSLYLRKNDAIINLVYLIFWYFVNFKHTFPYLEKFHFYFLLFQNNANIIGIKKWMFSRTFYFLLNIVFNFLNLTHMRSVGDYFSGTNHQKHEITTVRFVLLQWFPNIFYTI